MSEMFANVYACQHVRLTVLKQFRISDCSIFGGVDDRVQIVVLIIQDVILFIFPLSTCYYIGFQPVKMLFYLYSI